MNIIDFSINYADNVEITIPYGLLFTIIKDENNEDTVKSYFSITAIEDMDTFSNELMNVANSLKYNYGTDTKNFVINYVQSHFDSGIELKYRKAILLWTDNNNASRINTIIPCTTILTNNELILLTNEMKLLYKQLKDMSKKII